MPAPRSSKCCRTAMCRRWARPATASPALPAPTRPGSTSTTSRSSRSRVKYTDITRNGLSADDTPLAGVTIFIDKNGNGVNDDGAANQTVTAADGSWSFSGLDASYAGAKVFEVLPNGYVQTVGAAGYGITGTSGTNQTGLNFDNFKLFSISGTKYTDITGNGLSADDTPLARVTIFIDKNGNGVNDDGAANQTVTAADGSWSFSGLDASYAGAKVFEVL